MKDCFGLHGHYAFGSVAKEKSGVGRKSATEEPAAAVVGRGDTAAAAEGGGVV